MKEIILAVIVVLIVPVVYSLYGGENWSYHFDRCNYLTVNITGTLVIDEGEYTILNDCTKLQNNYWGCNCKDDYNFSVSFKSNAINNYSFEFDYLYSEETSEQEISGSSGGSSGSGNSGGAFTVRFLSNHSRTLMLKQGIRSVFWVDGNMHTILLISVSNDTAELEIRSEPITLTLKKDEPVEINIDNETLKMNLEETRGRVVFITFSKLGKEADEIILKEETAGIVILEAEEPEIVSETQEENATKEENASEEPSEEKLTEVRPKEPNFVVILIMLFVMSVLGLSAVIIYIKTTKKDAKS